VKQELVGGETRMKASVSSVAPVDYMKESRNLIACIAKMEKRGKERERKDGHGNGMGENEI